MKIQHKKLASGKWGKMPLAEQLSNVGSEVERAISWKEKDNEEYSQLAADRALELLSLTKGSLKERSKLKEVARTYELLVDYFKGDNRFKTSSSSWRNYFHYFTLLSAKKRSS